MNSAAEVSLTALRSGQIHVLAGATRTPGREQFAHFTAPYRDEAFKIFVRSEDLDRYENADLGELLRRNMRLGLVSEYVYGEEIASFTEDLTYGDQFQHALIPEVNYDRLLSREIDGLIDDPAVAAAILRRRGLEDDLSALDLSLGKDEVRLMLSKASVDDALKERLDAALEAFRRDGAYQKIVSRYRPNG